jgi:anthranilate synthase component 2/para-aminobenzoate synthetase component 2
MIYIIDHKDSFTHNIVHQLLKFDKKVECKDFNKVNYKKLNEADTIVLSPGPGSPKDYPISSKIYKKYKYKKKNYWYLFRFSTNII